MSKSDFGEPFQTILRASLTQRVRDGKWLGRVRWWSEKVSWGFVFSVSHCQHFFALGKTEGPDSVEIASRSRVGDLVYFELETDEGGLPFAKILRLASRGKVERYFVGPHVAYQVISEHTLNRPRRRKRRLPSSLLSATDVAFDL